MYTVRKELKSLLFIYRYGRYKPEVNFKNQRVIRTSLSDAPDMSTERTRVLHFPPPFCAMRKKSTVCTRSPLCLDAGMPGTCIG